MSVSGFNSCYFIGAAPLFVVWSSIALRQAAVFTYVFPASVVIDFKGQPEKRINQAAVFLVHEVRRPMFRERERETIQFKIPSLYAFFAVRDCI